MYKKIPSEDSEGVREDRATSALLLRVRPCAPNLELLLGEREDLAVGRHHDTHNVARVQLPLHAVLERLGDGAAEGALPEVDDRVGLVLLELAAVHELVGRRQDGDRLDAEVARRRLDPDDEVLAHLRVGQPTARRRRRFLGRDRPLHGPDAVAKRLLPHLVLEQIAGILVHEEEDEKSLAPHHLGQLRLVRRGELFGVQNHDDGARIRSLQAVEGARVLRVDRLDRSLQELSQQHEPVLHVHELLRRAVERRHLVAELGAIEPVRETLAGHHLRQGQAVLLRLATSLLVPGLGLRRHIRQNIRRHRSHRRCLDRHFLVHLS